MCSINQNPNHMNYIRHIGVLLLALMSTTAWSQSISGTVTDENNQPLPGATVLVQGTTRGVSSDFDGRYLINASQGETLEFSFIGYATQSVVVSAATHDVQLNLDNELEEVVVTAFGIKRNPKNLGYSVSKVSSGEITENNESYVHGYCNR